MCSWTFPEEKKKKLPLPVYEIQALYRDKVKPQVGIAE